MEEEINNYFNSSCAQFQVQNNLNHSFDLEDMLKNGLPFDHGDNDDNFFFDLMSASDLGAPNTYPHYKKGKVLHKRATSKRINKPFNE